MPLGHGSLDGVSKVGRKPHKLWPVFCNLASASLTAPFRRQYPILQMQTLRFQKETDLPKDPKQDEVKSDY